MYGYSTQLVSQLLDLGTRETDEVARRFPKVQRRVSGNPGLYV
jgi:hypothetical protein